MCACMTACVCLCVQPLELIKNVCCNLFYYGGHLWLHIHLGQPIPKPKPSPGSLPPHGIIPERVVITFAVLFQMHFYLPNLNKSNFRFSLESSTLSVAACIPGHRRGCGLGGFRGTGGTLCICLCRNVIKNLKTLMKTNFSPGLTKLTHIEDAEKKSRTTEAEAAKGKAKENRCLQLLARNTRNPAAAAVKLQKCNYKTLFGLHPTHTNTQKHKSTMWIRRVPFAS